MPEWSINISLIRLNVVLTLMLCTGEPIDRFSDNWQMAIRSLIKQVTQRQMNSSIIIKSCHGQLNFFDT